MLVTQVFVASATGSLPGMTHQLDWSVLVAVPAMNPNPSLVPSVPAGYMGTLAKPAGLIPRGDQCITLFGNFQVPLAITGTLGFPDTGPLTIGLSAPIRGAGVRITNTIFGGVCLAFLRTLDPFGAPIPSLADPVLGEMSIAVAGGATPCPPPLGYLPNAPYLGLLSDAVNISTLIFRTTAAGGNTTVLIGPLEFRDDPPPLTSPAAHFRSRSAAHLAPLSVSGAAHGVRP